MSYNTATDILLIGRVSFEDFPQSEVERAILSADSEINLLIPPLTADQKGYDRYARRLPLIKEAHAYLSMSYLFRIKLYDEATRGESSDFLTVPGITVGPHTPEKNVQAELYLKLANDYREKAQELIKKCKVRVPIVRRPTALRIG